MALGETTPGPLIMVVAFVGFLGGVNHSLLGSEHLFFAGALGAVIVTWFTFLFSFVFIFAGAPIIESTHNEIKFTAPLTAITAAVVGVILNLALFFSYHVLWPQGFSGHFDIVAALITVAAFIALFRFNINVLYVIFASALVGLAVTFF
ncbi:chromate transporter family protein [Acinetobacter baumannii 1552865]|nr:chromate transporter family protein [Acinetobacter baumannii 1552865]